MKTIVLENFRYGLDTRRSAISSSLGVLTILENAFVNQGAEIESRKAFVKLGTLPTGCFDIVALPNGLVTFGSVSPPTITGGLAGLVSYQRLRHPYFALDGVAAQIQTHLNPNRLTEPVMSGITHSCSFNGKAFAIASYTPSEDSGLDVFDDYFSGTFYYYNAQPVLNCLQGRLDFQSSTYSGGAASNYWLAYLFTYYTQAILGSSFTVKFAAAADVSINITSPIASSFALTVDDTANGMLGTQLFTAAIDAVTATGATVIIYLTKASAGIKNVSVLTAPNVVNGAVSGTVDLLNGATISFDVSLLQTAIDIANKVNQTGTGYSAQANIIGTNVAQLVITAPPNFGAIPNAANLHITSGNINVSATSLAGSGIDGAQTFALANGVSASDGAGQVQRVIFNVPVYPQGSYEATMVYNNIRYTLGRGNITTRRATATFYLIAGSSGSIGPITWVDGTNLLSSTVVYNTSLIQTAKDVIANIVTKWNATVGQYRWSSGGGSPVIRNEDTWLAYLAQTTNANGDVIYGVSIMAPEGEQYNGVNNLTITATTLTVAETSNGVGVNSLVLSADGATSNGTFLYALGTKLYMARGSVFNFSSIGDATKWEQQDSGAGFQPAYDQSLAPSDVVSLCNYQGKLAVFCNRSIIIYNVNADPTLMSQSQNMMNIGTMAPQSTQAIGEEDVLFLASTGVRSLRVRDSSLAAIVVDVGSPIDNLITTALNTAGTNANAFAVVEPTSNTYWLFLKDTFYVLSYFPTLKITAWSTFKPTYRTSLGSPNSQTFNYTTVIGQRYIWVQGNALSLADGGNIPPFDENNSYVATSTVATVTTSLLEGNAPPFTSVLLAETIFSPIKAVVYNNQIYLLADNGDVFVYGGTDNNTYDGSIVTVETPWLDDKSPSRNKGFVSVDLGISGKWSLTAGCDPISGTLEAIATTGDPATPDSSVDSTYDKLMISYISNGTHFRLKAISDASNIGVIKLSTLSIKYEPQDEK